MKKPVIYKIINLTNGKFYVGSTNNQRERFRVHRSRLRRSAHHCAHLQAAWNKYGEYSFLFRVVEDVASEALLQAAEDIWLTEWVGNENCYNHGLRSGAPWRGAAKELHPNFGKHWPEETKQLLREARARQADPRTGKVHSDETKAKISASKRANPSRHWLGKERSEETKAKISEAQKGVPKSPRVYTPEGLERARANMKRHAATHVVKGLESVLAKFPEAIQERYDFSHAVYTGALERITGVICGQHGVFSQYAARFRKEAGCPECGAMRRAESKKAQMKEAWSTPAERGKMLAARKKKVAP